MIDYSFSLIDFEYILLITVRIASFVFVAPFFSQGGVPAQAKIGLSFFIAIIQGYLDMEWRCSKKELQVCS